ncbi:Protein CBG10286 [Caenorhabditis briggsae]|uniref:Protein CBG10286 n=1 Tax=Caenorhabditis briggsae TaxID=6238 RepID=A8XAP3_CAEBR|nr:Protein CBG10286 [Caenorhabditis briggsae]CAP29708.2 Protein CBG10286 [Caenorhabditis briggsae]
MARASDDDVICNDEENKREVDCQKAVLGVAPPPGCATDPMSSLRRLRSSDPPTIIQRGRGTQRCPEKSASNQISGRLRSSFRDDPIPVPPRSHLRSADIPTTNQQGIGVQILSATGRSTASLAPRARLTSSDAPTSTTRGRSTQRTPATINQRASRRRSYSRYATSSLVPPYRRSASVSQPYTPEASQKPKKAPRKRPASYKAFGCHRRRRSQYPTTA